MLIATIPNSFIAPIPASLRAPCCYPPAVSGRRPRRHVVLRGCAAAAQPRSSPFNSDFSAAGSNVNTPRSSPTPNGPTWENLLGCNVLAPPAANPPVAILRFMGGFAAGSAPQRLYGTFLEEISRRGNVAIIAVPVSPSLDHTTLAANAAESLGAATRALTSRYAVSWLPCFGIGHSLGAKLQVLAACDSASRSAQGPVVANLLISFNNFSTRDSIPRWDELSSTLKGSEGVQRSAKELGELAGKLGDLLQGLDVDALSGGRAAPESIGRAADVLRTLGNGLSSVTGGVAKMGEISPSPDEVMSIVGARYSVPDNLVLSFSRDDLDQSEDLVKVLQARFGKQKTVIRKLDGTHVTPLTPRLSRKDGDGGFAGVGSRVVDDEIRKAASGVNKELDQAVAVAVAFLRLHLEVLAEKKMIS